MFGLWKIVVGIIIGMIISTGPMGHNIAIVVRTVWNTVIKIL